MKPVRRAELQVKRARKALVELNYPGVQAACREALSYNPQSAEAYLILGQVAVDRGELDQAVGLFQRSSQLEPQNPSALVWLARTLSTTHQLKSALAIANHAVELRPRDAASLHSLGMVFANAGDHARAIQLFQMAVDLAPRNTLYLADLGVGQEIMGSVEASEKCFRRCISIDPGYYVAYAKLVELRKQTATENFIPVLERLFDQLPEDIVRRLEIGYALSKSYEDIGDFPAALESLRRGKQAKRRRLSYRYDNDRDLFAAAAASFPGPAAVAAPATAAAPIFVIGMPRSGTSLTDRILSSHPDVASGGEMQTVAIALNQLTGSSGRSALQAEALRRAGPLQMTQLGQTYLSEAAAVAGASRRTVDKLPFNFLFAGVIHRALPNARIVCLRRNAIDVCLSNYRIFFHPQSAFHDYAYDLCDIARYYLLFDRLIARWSAALPPDRFISLQYESLVADQEAETRRLLDFCALEWDERCLSFHHNAAGLATPSRQQVREPMFTSSIGRWRKYGDALDPMIEILREGGVISDDT